MATKTAYLVLENGTVFTGEAFGKVGEVTGEIVFTTGMTGYLETLTDPGYYGQIIMQTFPLIGNYGIIPEDFENKEVFAKAYIVKHLCQEPSNFRCEGSLDIFLKERGIVGLSGIDTRALTKLIREHGVMNGKICTSPPTDADSDEAKKYKVVDAIANVSLKDEHPLIKSQKGNAKYKVALIDFGSKRGIATELIERDCEIIAFPHNFKAEDVLAINPDGIMLSNGPGDPSDPANTPIVEELKKIVASNKAIFGICLGHLLLARANDYKTKKLKFGHRGSNQPAKDLKSGRAYITSQNHGYTVIVDESDKNLSFVNVNDRSCEGMDYGKSFSVQFHPESRGGPLDTNFLFDKFIENMSK
ncbi:MAG: glutamine-hydrolyzing carbamoyl-phosphate synthase small subunit [Oscillospiraceae bacterium]|nr:glutamine-hydrolyzing carbamoyl-phosphate synthase small subunit [Oscillospiraceae bacterium]